MKIPSNSFTLLSLANSSPQLNRPNNLFKLVSLSPQIIATSPHNHHNLHHHHHQANFSTFSAASSLLFNYLTLNKSNKNISSSSYPRCYTVGSSTMDMLSSTQKPIDELIIADHNSFRELYDRFKRNQANYQERQNIANELIREIAIHSISEEVTLYPALEKIAISGKVLADHLRAEHQIVKEGLYELDKMSVKDVGYNEKLEKVMQELEHHMREEEEEDLRELASKVSEGDLKKLGRKFDGAKKVVPTRPHPSAPVQPSLEVLAGVLTAPIDKMRDMARSFAHRQVEE